MGVFSRSWQIAKASFKVVKHEKELIIFPILSIIFSALLLFALAIPFLIDFVINAAAPSITFSIFHYFLIFILYFGLAFIATFFNFCVVYTAAIHFSKGNPTFGKTIKYAFSKIHLIFIWSLVAATAGLILNLIEGIAEKMKGVGKIVLLVLRGVLGFVWGVVTIFVIPAMVYHNLDPFAAIKKSVKVLKKTWGEYLIKYFSMSIIISVFAFIGIIIFGPLILIGLINAHILLTIIMVLLLILYLIVISLIFGIAGKIFDTALYVYAETGKVVGEYNKEMMKNAFKQQKNNYLVCKNL